MQINDSARHGSRSHYPPASSHAPRSTAPQDYDNHLNGAEKGNLRGSWAQGPHVDCTWEELHGYDPDLHDRIRRLASSFGYG